VELKDLGDPSTWRTKVVNNLVDVPTGSKMGDQSSGSFSTVPFTVNRPIPPGLMGLEDLRRAEEGPSKRPQSLTSLKTPRTIKRSKVIESEDEEEEEEEEEEEDNEKDKDFNP
jgi:hypothetical protein